MSKVQAVAAVAIVVLLPAAAVYAGCMGEEEPKVSARFSKYAADTLRDFTVRHTKLYATGVMTSKFVLSAITTLTKQVSAVGEKEVQAGVEIEKTYAEAKKRLAIEELSSDIVMKQISQGYDPCGSYNRDKAIFSADKTTRDKVADNVGNYEYASFGDVAAAVRQRESDHRQKYCTKDEQDAGLCTMKNDGLAGANMNPNLLLRAKAGLTPEEQAAKRAYISNVLGLPDPIPPAGADKSAMDNYAQIKAEKDVYTGMAAYSLESISQENENLIPLLRERGEQYFGTSARGIQWQKSLTTQEDVGIMRDLIQIQALLLKDAQMSLRQGYRTEGNIAALSKMATQLKAAAVNRAATAMEVQATNTKIK